MGGGIYLRRRTPLSKSLIFSTTQQDNLIYGLKATIILSFKKENTQQTNSRLKETPASDKTSNHTQPNSLSKSTFGEISIFIMFRLLTPLTLSLTLTLTLLLQPALTAPTTPSSPLIPNRNSNITPRQGSGCFCGVITGTSCGSRTSSGLSLSGDCASQTLYSCAVSFDNAVVEKRCLVCREEGQDGFDGCLLGLGL